MRLEWSSKAYSDLGRLHEFLAPKNAGAAKRAVRTLVTTAARLIEHPRMGERLEEFAPREVRRIVVGDYEIRYEVRDLTLAVLRVWHTREDR